MANVLLTGAAGAIGMDLAFSLHQAKVNTYATEADDDNFSLVNKNCKYYKKVFKVPRADSDNYIHTINKIINGFFIPPVKYNSKASCKVS